MASLERRSDLLAAGRSRHDLDNQIRTGKVLVPFRGIHGVPGLSMPDRFRAALMTQQDAAVLGHRSAGVWQRLRWLPDEWSAADACVDLLVPRGDRHRNRPGLTLRNGSLDPADVEQVRGLPVTTVARTCIDLLRDGVLDPDASIAVIDGALTQGRCSRSDLDATVQRLGSRRGVLRAAEALRLVRGGVDSPPETQLRLGLIRHGVPDDLLRTGLTINDDRGLCLAKGDFGIPALMMWGEYDGFEIHTLKPAFSKDRRGDRWLESRGWLVKRYTNDDRLNLTTVANDWIASMRAAPDRIAAIDPRRSPELATARAWLAANADFCRVMRSLRPSMPSHASAASKRMTRRR